MHISFAVRGRGFAGLLLIGWIGVSRMAAPASAAGSAWRIHENARLIEHASNDGDSFHVQCGRAHYIVRLYFVDAPETADTFPDRVKEQAAYFGIGEKEAMQVGQQAARFSARFLAGSFTVYTRREDARGNSGKSRYFAMVKANDRWLSAELVRAGLARIYGMRTDLPDGAPARKRIADLKVLERAARRNREGAWGKRRRGSGD